jgi:hypothetical protein
MSDSKQEQFKRIRRISRIAMKQPISFALSCEAASLLRSLTQRWDLCDRADRHWQQTTAVLRLTKSGKQYSRRHLIVWAACSRWLKANV